MEYMDAKKDTVLRVRLPAEQRFGLEHFAARSGVPLSEFVRQVLAEGLTTLAPVVVALHPEGGEHAQERDKQ